jgi:hypothetical protein
MVCESMLEVSELEDLLHSPGITTQLRVLLCLAVKPIGARQLSVVRKTAIVAGWTTAKKLNLSEYLKRAKGLAILTPDGWKLTQQGRDLVSANVKRPGAVPPQLGVTTKLRSHLDKIQSGSTRAFADEAIKCLEYGLRRSAVVSAWIAAVGVLYDYVLATRLAEFNAAGMKKMQAKWKPVGSLDDLADLKESTFLELCEAASIFGKSVKQELENCLRLRNGCGHPNSLQIGDARVVAHIEQLILNVFEKY